MAQDERTAFARLFSQRRSDLGLSVIDIAARSGSPIEVVVAWDRGRAVPDQDNLSQVAEILRLPKPLLAEAVRRVNESRRGAPVLDPPTDDERFHIEEAPAAETSPPSDAGTEPSTGVRSNPVGRIFPFVFGVLGNMFTELRESMGRRRRIARAPVTQPSYLEDRRQIVTYRLRMVFTAAGVMVMALILRWSLTGLGSAVADLWNALTGAL